MDYKVKLINFPDAAEVYSGNSLEEACQKAIECGFEAGVYDSTGMFVTSFSPIYGQRTRWDLIGFPDQKAETD